MSLQKLFQSVPKQMWRQFIIGSVVIVCGLVGLALALSHFKKNHIQANQQNKEIKEIEELLNQKKQVAELQQSVGDKPTITPRHVESSGDIRSTARIPVVDFNSKQAFQFVGEKDLSYIPTGAVFQAKMITPIKTSLQATFIMAETTAEFRMDAKRSIARGSRLVGRARLNPVLKGVVVEFYKLITPQGQEKAISALALDENVFPELEGIYFSNDLERYSTALAFGFLSGFSDSARDRTPTIYGNIDQNTLRNNVLGGLSTASFQIAEDLIREIRERAVEYVVIPAGKNIFIALTNRYVVQQETGQ